MIKEELLKFAKFTGSSLISRLLAGLLNYVISDKVIFKKSVL